MCDVLKFALENFYAKSLQVWSWNQPEAQVLPSRRDCGKVRVEDGLELSGTWSSRCRNCRTGNSWSSKSVKVASNDQLILVLFRQPYKMISFSWSVEFGIQRTNVGTRDRVHADMDSRDVQNDSTVYIPQVIRMLNASVLLVCIPAIVRTNLFHYAMSHRDNCYPRFNYEGCVFPTDCSIHSQLHPSRWYNLTIFFLPLALS